MLLQVVSCEPYGGVRVPGFPLSNSGIASLRVSCDIHVKSHSEENQVTEPQRNLRTLPRANQQKETKTWI